MEPNRNVLGEVQTLLFPVPQVVAVHQTSDSSRMTSNAVSLFLVEVVVQTIKLLMMSSSNIGPHVQDRSFVQDCSSCSTPWLFWAAEDVETFFFCARS